MERPIQGLNVNVLWIERTTTPLQHFFMFRMAWVGKNRQEMGVAGNPADIIRRTGPLAIEDPRVARSPLVIGDTLQEHFVLPAVTEVVLVH